MTTADLRAVALELGGDPIIRTRPAAVQGEPFSDGTWFEPTSEGGT
jgi:hypothetical protein